MVSRKISKWVGVVTLFVLVTPACIQRADTSPESTAGAAGGGPIPTIVVLSNVQAADPIEFEMTRQVVENMRRLGLDVEHRAMPWEQQADIVWYKRNAWQMTAWRMVGRPERMDPDEFTVNLFHSSTAETGYNFVGFKDPRYDELAMKQRQATTEQQREQLIYQAQEIIADEVPYVFVAYPQLPYGYRSDVWDPDSIVEAKGIGIKNFWTWIKAEPVGEEKTFILNAGDVVQAVNPLYISGSADSWITELIWDRLMFISPSGEPRPWAARSVKWEDDTHAVVELRKGMTWHDGKPVTAADVVFSFEVPASGESPMYQPFADKIARVEAVDDLTARFTLKEPWAAFEAASLSKVNLIPKHVWEPIIEELETKEDNAESYQEDHPIGSGPYKFVRSKFSEEIVLEANPDHFSPPKADGWILRIIPSAESALGQLKTGELNFLSEWEGDPTVLAEAARENPDIEAVDTTEIGFRFFALNNRLEPFDDRAFREAIAHVVPRDSLVENVFKGYGVPADSFVSPALGKWHNPDLPHYEYSIEEAKQVLENAGYGWTDKGELVAPKGE
jgi:peptide/nickel transport system substrate-binding protein